MFISGLQVNWLGAEDIKNMKKKRLLSFLIELNFNFAESIKKVVKIAIFIHQFTYEIVVKM
jgi:hypothetical protein